jgi:hypothetical protein
MEASTRCVGPPETGIEAIDLRVGGTAIGTEHRRRSQCPGRLRGNRGPGGPSFVRLNATSTATSASAETYGRPRAGRYPMV